MSMQRWIRGLTALMGLTVCLDGVEAGYGRRAAPCGLGAPACGPGAPACVVYDEVEVVRYRTVYETAYRDVRCQVARPIFETTMREVRQTVSTPVVEWVEREQT